MAEYTLYCDAVSGNCYKVGLMLALAGCDWQPVLVDYPAGGTRSDQYKSDFNEFGEMPVLERKGTRQSQGDGSFGTFVKSLMKFLGG
jgi:glutathione S-transferase